MTGVDVLDKVLAGIDAAKKAGLEPIKINAVIVRGHNEDEVVDFAAFAREHDVKMRFIESCRSIRVTSGRARTSFSGREIRETYPCKVPLVGVHVARGSETSSRFVSLMARPERWHLAPVTEPFCGPAHAFVLLPTDRFEPACLQLSNTRCATSFAWRLTR